MNAPDPTSPGWKIWAVLILVYAQGRADGAKLGDRFTQEEFVDAVCRSGALEALQEATLHVADRRWLWSRRHVASEFNVRRTTGDKREASAAPRGDR